MSSKPKKKLLTIEITEPDTPGEEARLVATASNSEDKTSLTVTINVGKFRIAEAIGEVNALIERIF